MSQQSREAANAEPKDHPTEGATEPPTDAGPWFDLLSYLLACLPDRIGPERPLRLTPVAPEEWSSQLKRCRDEIKGAARPKGSLWCGIRQE